MSTKSLLRHMKKLTRIQADREVRWGENVYTTDTYKCSNWQTRVPPHQPSSSALITGSDRPPSSSYNQMSLVAWSLVTRTLTSFIQLVGEKSRFRVTWLTSHGFHALLHINTVSKAIRKTPFCQVSSYLWFFFSFLHFCLKNGCFVSNSGV